MDERKALQELARSVPDEDPAARERARARLRALIEAEGVTAPPRARSARAPWAAAAIVAAVMGGILLMQAVAGPERLAGALDLATTALGQRGRGVEPGEYAYTRSVGTALKSFESLTDGASWTYQVRVRREVWLATDGSGSVVERYAHPRFFTAADRAAWREAGSPDLTPPSLRLDFAPGDMPTGPFEEVRGDPLALVGAIEDRANRIRSGWLAGDLGFITEYLGESPSSPELRAALLELIAPLDLAWDGDAVDPLGRSGVSLSIEVGGIRTTLVFDPTDSVLLSYTRERPDQDLVITSHAFVERGIVDAVGIRPEGSGT
jgi:hypothetical protein